MDIFNGKEASNILKVFSKNERVDLNRFSFVKNGVGILKFRSQINSS